VLIWATPPGAVTAHKGLLDAGFKGQIYQSYGVTNPSFLDLGGKIGANGVNGTIISALAIAIYDQLPSGLSYKSSIDAYVRAYRAEYAGATPTSFGGHAWDAGTIFIEAAKRAIAKGGNPSDLEPFRASVRDEIETLRGFKGISGVFNFSKADHNGLGPSTANMITVQNGQYRLLRR